MSILPILLALFITPQQDFREKVVDLKVLAQPASQAVKQLADATGTRLAVSNEVSNEIIVLNLTNAKLGETMDRIALVTGAAWKEEPSAWVLSRPSGLAQEQERAEAAIRLKAITDRLAQLRQEAAELSPWSEELANKLVRDLDAQVQIAMQGKEADQKAIDRIGRETPAVRAIRSIITKLDPQLLEKARNNRIVLSTSPTRMQYPMPNGAVQIIQQAFEQHRMYVAADARLKEGRPKSESTYYWGDLSNPEYQPGGNPDDGAVKALLSLTGYESGAVGVAFSILDRSGHSIIHADSSFSPKRADVAPFDLGETATKTVELSEIAVKLTAAVKSGGTGPSTSTQMIGSTKEGETIEISLQGNPKGEPMLALNAELKEAVLDPVGRDPLSFAASESLIGLSKEWDLDLVASLPDSVFERITPSITGPSTFSKLLGGAHNSMSMNREQKWLTFRPLLPVYSRAVQINREALKVLLRQIDVNGFVGLEDLSNYARVSSESPVFGIAGTYCRLLNSTAAPSGLRDGQAWQFYKLYGALTQPQRQTLKSGGTIPFQQLAPAQLGAVRQLVFEGDTGPEQKNSTGEMRGYGFRGLERTDVLPDGLPSDGFIEMPTVTEDAVIAKMSNTGFSQMASYKELAAYKFQEGDSNLLETVGFPPTFDKYQLAVASKHMLTVMLKPNYGVSKRLTDGTVKGGAPVDYGSLPQAFRDKVDALAVIYKQNFGRGG